MASPRNLPPVPVPWSSGRIVYRVRGIRKAAILEPLMSKLSRRQALKAVAAAGAVTGCLPSSRKQEARARMQDKDKKKTDAVVAVTPQGFPWQTTDPFLFCVHHVDAYPAGTSGGASGVSGRTRPGAGLRGQGRLAHVPRRVVPGFPQHPHRGFETVTVGAAGFSITPIRWAPPPLRQRRRAVDDRRARHRPRRDVPAGRAPAPNPLELFQIWLNLPSRDKLVDPHFAMLWSHTIPSVVHDRRGGHRDRGGGRHSATCARRAAAPLLGSPRTATWRSGPSAGAAARWTLPPAPGTNRALYFFAARLDVGGLRARHPSSCARLDVG